MGKATIKSHIGEALYSIEVQHDMRRINQSITRLTERLTKINEELAEAQSQEFDCSTEDQPTDESDLVEDPPDDEDNIEDPPDDENNIEDPPDDEEDPGTYTISGTVTGE